MIQCYNDIITPSKSRTVYNIREEGPDDWKTFIANEQFNGVLEKTIAAVFNNDLPNHKPLWIVGTYGTGKSHAGAVLQHLMCDSLADIQDYVDLEYKDAKFDMLRTNLLTLREKKRLFPVKLYGQQSIVHEDDLSLQIQREVKSALENAGINISVKTDFDTYINHINENNQFWEMLIERSPKLASVTPDIKKLKADLATYETGVLDKVNEALRENRFDVRMESENLVSWIIEVQNKLKEQKVYDGLFIIWDEFTEIMTSAIGTRLLVRLQEISEAMMSPENDSYFLFISHPSALNNLNEQEREKTKGRYHFMSYNMEPVSAFKIMSRKFVILNDEEHKALVDDFYSEHQDLLEIFSHESNKPEETKADIQKLYPLHPSTANLATFYAREAGSSSRSVFEFLACNTIKSFLQDENAYAEYETITADYLWDYVLPAFNEDTAKYGAVTERYNSYHGKVEHQGPEYAAIFKGILLLNALNNIANHDTVTPSEENIRNLFKGTSYEASIDNVLNFFNEKSIIQRLPGDIFSIQFTALPSGEVEDIKNELLTTQFKYTDMVAKFSDIAMTEFNRNFANIARPFKIEVYSQQANEYTLLNKIENGFKTVKGYEVFIAVLVAKNFDELNFLKTFAHNYKGDSRFKDITLVVFDTVLEQPNYDRFIDFMATATCAMRHSLNDQQETFTNNAKKLVKEWINKMRSGNFTYFIGGEEDTCAGSKFVSTINNCISPIIFSSGPESLPIIQAKFSKTYWQKSSVKKVVDSILQFNTKDEVLKSITGQSKHVEMLMQDSVDDNLIWKADVDPEHPMKKVADFIDKAFEGTNKNQEFNLGEKLEDLSRPPYGLYQSYAGMAMVAFAMRKYVKRIFDLSGKPRESRHIVDDVVELFKAWEDGKKSNKLNFMFESKDSADLCKKMISIFKLNKLTEYKDVSSLTDARWAMFAYMKKKGYPLWSLKNIADCTPDISQLIDDITKVCDPNGLSDQKLIAETAKLIKKLELEMSVFLVNEENFKNGFFAYLQKDDVVNIKEEEFDEAYEYLQKHLEAEIGRWTEQEVSAKLKDWRLSKVTPPQPPVPPVPPTPPVPVPPAPPTPNKRKEALEKVNATGADRLKELITKMCEQENEFVIDTILRYV